MFEASGGYFLRKFGIWAKPFRSPSPLQTSSSPAEVRIGPPVEARFRATNRETDDEPTILWFYGDIMGYNMYNIIISYKI